MEKPKTTRLQVTLPTDLVEKLDGVCEKSCCSRSAYIEYMLATSLMSYNIMVEKTAEGLLKAATQDVE